MNYEAVKGRIALSAIPTERNQDRLQNIPHEEILDLSIVYRLIVASTEERMESILITNDMLERMGITAKQLREDTLELAPKLRPITIASIESVLTEALGESGMPMPDNICEVPMYIASVPDLHYGAGILAYPDFFEKATKCMGGDFYLLPSSIHELLLLADTGEEDPMTLQSIVSEVNDTTVAENDQLSYHAYHYDSKLQIFELANVYRSRRDLQEEMLCEPSDSFRLWKKENVQA